MSIFPQDLVAEQVLYGAAKLMNDPDRTDYTNVVMLPFLSMAVLELNDHLIESNVAVTNQVDLVHVRIGENYVINLPINLMDVQEVGERLAGTENQFVRLTKKEFPIEYPASSSLVFWCWENQRIIFNPNGATVPMEVEIKYISAPYRGTEDASQIIGPRGGTMYLTYKLAALLAMFVGENPTRAAILNEEADKSLERIIGISNKGKQQIMTRHRPFRAGYKRRGW